VSGSLWTVFKLSLIAVVALLLVGFAIPTRNSVPDFATVYLDDLSRTYLAQPCLQEWKSRPGSGVVYASSAPLFSP
jgi:hypothetical protein